MSQSPYIFVAILFVAFLGTVIVSNVLALLVAGIIRLATFMKVKKIW
jgi:ABC-type dipeptide/oligopeptide/nickel transport system permease subunit